MQSRSYRMVDSIRQNSWAGPRKNLRFKMFRFRSFRTLAAGSSLISVSAASVFHKSSDSTDNNKNAAFSLHSFTLAAATVTRCSRAISTGVSIIGDYKYSLRTSLIRGMSSDDVDTLKSQVHLRSAHKLVKLARENGGVYIKFGQHLSALVYLVPPEYTETLRVLQDNCPVSSREQIDEVFQQDLGQSLDQTFQEFKFPPVGSASLAQVHEAILKDGVRVAVKVQHPSIQMYAEIDMAMTSGIAKVVKTLFPEFELDWLADETRINLPREIDFTIEAHNSKQLASFIKEDKDFKHQLHVPHIYWATTKILCMEFVDGRRIDDRRYLQENHVDAGKVARALTDSFNRMIFKYGFVHCDPHPGNVFIKADRRFKNGFKIYLLDHGLYRHLDEEFRAQYAKIWVALIAGDEKKIQQCSKYFGGDDDYYRLLSSIMTARSWDALSSSAIHTQRTPEELKKIQENASKFAQRIAELLAKVPRPLLLLLKTNDLLRSVDQTLTDGGPYGQIYTAISTLKIAHRTIYDHRRQVAIEESRKITGLFSHFLSLIRVKLSNWVLGVRLQLVLAKLSCTQLLAQMWYMTM